jgi:hypothetical protein
MKEKKLLRISLIVLGLAVVPLLVVVYALLHHKGTPALSWPTTHHGLDHLLSWLGIDPASLDPSRFLDRLASLPGTSQDSGKGGAVNGASGGGGVGGGPLPWGHDPFTDGFRKRLPQSASDVGNRVIHERRSGQSQR